MSLKYITSSKKIVYEHSNGEIELIEENSPSEPLISPNKKSFVYIAPLEWETIGKVYLYDLENQLKKVLIDPVDNTLVPKQIAWIDDENIVLILGMAFGTVSVGGNIFTYNLTTGELKRITNHEEDVQITSFNINENKIVARGIRYVDEKFLKYQDYHFYFEFE